MKKPFSVQDNLTYSRYIDFYRFFLVFGGEALLERA